MATADALRDTRIPLTHGSGAMAPVGFGTLIPDPLATKQTTKIALEVGFRQGSRLMSDAGAMLFAAADTD